MVFANEKGRYDAFIAELATSELSAYASETLGLEEVRSPLEQWKEKLFASSDDHPGTELILDLFHIARHMGQSDGGAPKFFLVAPPTSTSCSRCAGRATVTKESMSTTSEQPERRSMVLQGLRPWLRRSRMIRAPRPRGSNTFIARSISSSVALRSTRWR